MVERLDKIKGWRTALLVVVAIAALLIALHLILRKGSDVAFVGAIAWPVVTLVAIAAGRNLGQDLAGGGGVAGAAMALLTSRKPEPAPQVQP